MSDKLKETVEEFKEKVTKKAEVEILKEDTNAKKAFLDNKRVTSQLETLKQNEKDIEIAKNSNFGALTSKQIKDLQDASDEYIKAAQESMYFINPTFSDIVPFFRKNFILIGGRTGDGKSTTVANIVHSVLGQHDPKTGRTRRALVITNEEKAEDFYNRVTCMIKGWHYVNHNKFTKEQTDTFNKYIPILASNGRLTVIDNNYNGSHGVTTTIEGIEMIFESLLANKEWYDVIIIDYYQNIISSKNDPSMSENDVQSRLSRMMDKYKNIYPAPIVMMCQINAPDKDNKTPFQQRIKGRKIIMDPSTLAMEMTAKREELKTIWTVWKSRFTEAVGGEFKTGYDRGKFVEYTNEFAERVQNIRMRQRDKEINKNNGIKEIDFKKE